MAIAAIVAWSCGKDKPTSTIPDTIPPSAVVDLACIDSIGDGTIILLWTAPGDDSTFGRAAQYELRYSLAPISDTNWDSARTYLIITPPDTAGATDTVSVPNLPWWTTYYFALRTRDESGNRSALSNVTVVTPLPDSSLRLLVSAGDSTWTYDLYRNRRSLTGPSIGVETRDNHIFVLSDSARILDYDPDGILIDSIPVPDTIRSDGFIALPNDRFAMLDNVADIIGILDRQGHTLAIAAMRDGADGSRQNISGLVVGSALIVSEDGDRRLLRVNLDSYVVRVFKNLPGLPGPLGDLDWYAGRYYLCCGRHIFTFTEGGPPAIVARLESSTLTAIAVAGGHSFVAQADAGTIYAVNNSTGKAEIFLTGLDNPQDIELLRR